jgi:hypothetical protein
MSGQPGTYTAGTPEDVKKLREEMISQIMAGMTSGSTPYSGPLGTRADSGQTAAMNMLMRLSGNGKYSLPKTYSMPNQPRMAGYYGVNATSSAGVGPGTGPGAVVYPGANPGTVQPGTGPQPGPTIERGGIGPALTPQYGANVGPGPTPDVQASPSPGGDARAAVGPAAAPTGALRGGNINPLSLFQLLYAMRGTSNW